MDSHATRLFRAELDLSADGRTLTGYAVPFDIEAEVDDGDGPYFESFKRGAFRNVIRAPNRVPLHYTHSDALADWVGKGLRFNEDAKGLHTTWRLDDANDAGLSRERRETLSVLAYKVRDGQLPAFSVSFYAGYTHETSDRNGRVHRQRRQVNRIDHVALVPEGAYPMVEPLALRHASVRAKSSVETWSAWRDDYLARVTRKA